MWIEAERAALVSTVRQAARVGLLAECWRIACLSVNMLSYREYKDEAVAIHTIAADAACSIGDLRGKAVALVALARVVSERGGRARARSILEDAEKIFIAQGDPQGHALCHRELAYLDRYQGNYASARRRYLAMIEACRGVDLALETAALRGLGQIQLFAGNRSAALPMLERALDVSSDAGTVPRFLVLMSYGEACLQLGDTARAAAAFREVAAWSERVGATSGEGRSLCGLAQAALAEGDIAAAERLALRGYHRCRLLGEVNTNVFVSSALARVRLAQGRLKSAKKLAEDALADCRRAGDVVSQVQTLELLAEIHGAAGDHIAAAAARAEATALYPRRTARVGRCRPVMRTAVDFLSIFCRPTS